MFTQLINNQDRQADRQTDSLCYSIILCCVLYFRVCCLCFLSRVFISCHLFGSSRTSCRVRLVLPVACVSYLSCVSVLYTMFLRSGLVFFACVMCFVSRVVMCFVLVRCFRNGVSSPDIFLHSLITHLYTFLFSVVTFPDMFLLHASLYLYLSFVVFT